MTLEDIKNINHFQTFLYEQSQGIFLKESDSDFSKTICGTKLSAGILHILPATENLANIQFYHNLRLITINNYKIDKHNFHILQKHRDSLINVTHLHIWNIKQNDLDILELFPNITHLLVSYIRKADFSFSGLDKADKLTTLCLLNVNKIVDFNFLSAVQKSKLKNLSLQYTSSLTSFEGIDEFKNLESLSLFASTSESRKFVTLRNMNGINKLSKLFFFEIKYFKFDTVGLQQQLKHLKNLTYYKLGNEIYENI